MSLESESMHTNPNFYAYNSEKPISVGVDLGTSAIKIVNPLTQEKLRILSCVGELPEAKPPTPLARRENALENLVYKGEERQFLVGEAAKTFSPGARWVMYRGFASMTDFDYAVDAIKACLAALTPFKRKRERLEVNLIIGVPATFDIKYAKALKKKLFEDSPHSFSIQNYLTEEEKQVTLIVKDMQIWYQSFGSLYSYCVRNNEVDFSGTVIDIGFGLTNVVAFESLMPIRSACVTIPRAVGDIALYVRENLIRRGGGTDIPGVFTLGEILKDPDPVLRSRTLGTIRLKEEREKASLFVGQELWRETSFYVDKVLGSPASSKLIITGGGGSANFLGEYLRGAYSNLDVKLVGDIFSNADGLMLGAKDVWG